MQTTCRKCTVEIVMRGQSVDELGELGEDEAEADRIDGANELIAETHLISCALELRIEEISHKALTVKCPACGAPSQKDDACTHMVCGEANCGTKYCYFCGLGACGERAMGRGKRRAHNAPFLFFLKSCFIFLFLYSFFSAAASPGRIDCDGTVRNGWGTHNADWQTNSRRCPLHLEMLADGGIGNRAAVGVGAGAGAAAGADVDDDDAAWPADEENALRVFHHERALRELQKLIRFADEEVVEPLLEVTHGAATLHKIRTFRERPFFARRRLPPL